MPLTGDPRDWRAGSRLAHIWTVMGEMPDTGHVAGVDERKRSNCPLCRAVYFRLIDGLGEKPLVFKQDGIEMPRGTKRAERFRNEIHEIHEHAQSFRPGEDAPKQELPPKQDPAPKSSDLDRRAQLWIDWIQNVARPYFAKRDADGEVLDEWGMRQALAGAQALKQDVPVEFLKDSMTMHLPEHARDALGASKWCSSTFRRDDRQDGFHFSYPLVRALQAARLNVMFVGGKGTGKTTFVERLADLDDVEHTAVSCNGETGGADFYGIQKIGGDGGILESRFSELLKRPSRILVDEIDGADENILLMLNRLLANRMFYNPLTREEFRIHDACILFAGANTVGNGATALYGGRNAQDGAAMDRWIKVRLELDEALERKLFWDVIAA